MIACQISFYPLKTPAVIEQVNEVLGIIHSYDLDVQTNAMSTIVTGETPVVYQMLRTVTEKCQTDGIEFVLTLTVSNSCGWSADAENSQH